MVGHPARQLAAKSDDGVPGFDEAVRRLDGHKHMNSATTAGLRETDKISIV
jgi:hypothetical protein